MAVWQCGGAALQAATILVAMASGSVAVILVSIDFYDFISPFSP